jgi:ABC-type transport system involved in multi-copper enzyme maturation permease subunit
MSAINKKEVTRNSTWKTRFWAVVQYEILWNIRKRKFIGIIVVAFAFATLSLALPVVLYNRAGQPVPLNPDYSVNFSPNAFVFFLFALVTVMNSISGEFESGTIVPLLTKPVSRTFVFLGKLIAAFIMILSAYAVLFVYAAIGGTVVYGSQNNLQLIPLSLVGSIISTFVWVAIVLAIGSISKSSMIAALGAFGIFIGLLISTPIISIFSDQAWILSYLPSSGMAGTIKDLSISVSTGIDNIAPTLITYVLHPSSNITFYKISGFRPGQPTSMIELYTEPLSLVLLRSIAVAVAYILAFSFISWYAFKRAQIVE